ncbi:MAG: nucleoside triphosphate pyrophosphohydrolase [Ruminococcaceae bacterium]|nr:nucleoside triphosphate pyrophosphohydrolase [Oscillospiraceae bacterium]
MLKKDRYNAADLVTIVELLRLPGGCPWDREQTHVSLRKDLIEETYEVIEAIDNEDPVLLREELGDLLLQVVMHARIEEEAGRATFDEVAGDVCRKMIHRHPHVFGDTKAETVGEVLQNWESIKSEEKSRNTVTDKLNAIPRQLPALMRAAKVGKKAGVMDFPDADSALAKLREETREVEEALGGANGEEIFEEIGDLLFSAANLARKAGVDPEEALVRATDKFIRRFAAVEAAAEAEGSDLSALSQEKLDELWEKIKKN